MFWVFGVTKCRFSHKCNVCQKLGPPQLSASQMCKEIDGALPNRVSDQTTEADGLESLTSYPQNGASERPLMEIAPATISNQVLKANGWWITLISRWVNGRAGLCIFPTISYVFLYSKFIISHQIVQFPWKVLDFCFGSPLNYWGPRYFKEFPPLQSAFKSAWHDPQHH